MPRRRQRIVPGATAPAEGETPAADSAPEQPEATAPAEGETPAADSAPEQPEATAPAEGETPAADNAPESEVEERKQVRVICEGVLGPRGLRKGDITDDPAYVALLGKPRGRNLVEEVE